jgi:hypothetical protein
LTYGEEEEEGEGEEEGEEHKWPFEKSKTP